MSTPKTDTKVSSEPNYQEVMKTLPTTSAKIRYLHSLNIPRKEIALMVNRRYQHVRNVLITPTKKS